MAVQPACVCLWGASYFRFMHHPGQELATGRKRGKKLTPEAAPAFLPIMELTTRRQDDALIITVRGEVDLYNAKVLGDALEGAGQESVKNVVLDVEKVTYIDSTGIGILIKGKKNLKAAGGDLKLAQVQESIQDVFNRTKLDSIFKYYDTITAALADF